MRDRRAWADTHAALWPEEDAAELAHKTVKHVAGVKAADEVFVAEDGGRLIGFLELSLRTCGEGCISSPAPSCAASLKSAPTRSSTTPEPQDAHAAPGITEAERLVAFRKALRP